MPDGPNWENVKTYVLERLADELPANLIYHGIRHTRDDVLPAAERLAALAGLDSQEKLLLRIAVLYHDIGYTVQYENNEPIAVHIARETLPQFGFNAKQIETIAGLILATRMPQSPQNRLEELICDADLDSLGRDDFFTISHQLRAERQIINAETIPLDEWYQFQIEFLGSHAYFTPEARSLREQGKRTNIAKLKQLLMETSP
jgi:uncharacterized protein